MHIAQFVRKYSAKSNSGPVAKDKINSTHKWVEYSTDIAKMTSLLMSASFEDKCRLVQAIEIAERKKNWHYRQANFNLQKASFLLSCWQKAA